MSSDAGAKERVMHARSFTELRVEYVEMLLRLAERDASEQLFDRIEGLLGFRGLDGVIVPVSTGASAAEVHTPESTAAPPPQLNAPDTSADTSEHQEVVSESGTADKSEATERPSTITANRTGRMGQLAAVRCTMNDWGKHRWLGPRDADGWYRCRNGCGAGKKQLGSGPVVAAEHITPLPRIAARSAREQAAPRGGDEPREEHASSAPADPEEFADEEIIYRPEEPPAPPADDDWGDFGEQPEITVDGAPPVAEDLDARAADEEDELDEDGIVRPRPGARVLDPASFAPLVGRDDTPSLGRAAPCSRCETGQLARDPLEPGDPTAWACVICGHRPRLTREEAFQLERDLFAGKLRRREPSHGGARL